MAPKKAPDQIEVLERGNLYFFYRPRVEEHEPHGQQDIQRLYMILSPQGKKKYRLIVIGRKELPDPERAGQQRYWGFVEMVCRSPQKLEERLREQTYETKTRGERHLPAARPAGEGIFQIVRHGSHTHLIYSLELPKQPREVQHELHIEPEASYIVSIKNPQAGAPPAAGLDASRQAEFPASLQERFRGRRFSELDPPEFLDHEGAELMIIAASEDVSEELGIELHPKDEQRDSADIFADLRLDRSQHPLEPLFEGHWE